MVLPVTDTWWSGRLTHNLAIANNAIVSSLVLHGKNDTGNHQELIKVSFSLTFYIWEASDTCLDYTCTPARAAEEGCSNNPAVTLKALSAMAFSQYRLRRDPYSLQFNTTVLPQQLCQASADIHTETCLSFLNNLLQHTDVNKHENRLVLLLCHSCYQKRLTAASQHTPKAMQPAQPSPFCLALLSLWNWHNTLCTGTLPS